MSSFTETYVEFVAVDREGTVTVVTNKVTAYAKVIACFSSAKRFIPWHMNLGTLWTTGWFIKRKKQGVSAYTLEVIVSDE